MDGGGRLLRSLIEAGSGFLAFSRPRFAGIPDFEPAPVPRPSSRRSGRRLHFGVARIMPRTRRGGLGTLLTVALFAATGLYGAVRGGQYADYVARHGSPADVIAKVAGFPIAAITISGIKELDQREILDAAGITPNNSLLLVDPSAVRDRLKTIPLVQDAVVSKLFPDRLTIAVNERDPKAIWQLNGKLSIVSGDGVAIDTLQDDRFSGLPFVVGEGANTRVADFLALLDAAGDLRGRIVAGVLVAKRRWSLKMDNGLIADLPELNAGAAVARLAALDKDGKLLDKDLISVDLRMPNRITVRLSADAAAARAEALGKKPKSKGMPE